MNNETNVKKQDQDLKKRILFIILFVVYPAYILQACVISPLHTITDSDVAYKVLPLVFYFLGIIVDIAVIYITLAVLIYGMYRIDIYSFRSVMILSLVSPAFKNFLKLIISPLIDGVPTFNSFIVDIYSLAVSSLLEILQLAAVVFIAYRIIEIRKDDKPITPFVSLFDLKNPLLLCAFISALIISVIRLSMWIINDLAYYSSSVNMLFFLPYVLEIIGGVCGYLFIVYILISLSSREKLE